MKKFRQVIIGVKPSSFLKGEVGLFALRDLKKGTIINKSSEDEDLLYSKKVFNSQDQITQDVITNFGIRTYDGFFSLPNLNKMPISWFCNHSCEPNAGFDKNDNIVLIHDVLKGEEITHDYGCCISDPEYSFKCRCKKPTCRKIVTGNDWKNPQYYKKNKGNMCI